MSEVVVEENGQGRYQQSVKLGQHRLIADEPEAMGGADAGPAPYDLLLGALGACTSMTLRMYAERKGIALDRVRVALRHEKIDLDGARRDRIRRDILLEGELTPEQRRRLLEIAEKCPMHRTLAPSVLIESRLAE